MNRNPHKKSTPKRGAWSVEPVGYSDLDEIAGALLTSIEIAARHFRELESELRQIRNMPERCIR